MYVKFLKLYLSEMSLQVLIFKVLKKEKYKTHTIKTIYPYQYYTTEYRIKSCLSYRSNMKKIYSYKVQFKSCWLWLWHDMTKTYTQTYKLSGTRCSKYNKGKACYSISQKYIFLTIIITWFWRRNKKSQTSVAHAYWKADWFRFNSVTEIRSLTTLYSTNIIIIHTFHYHWTALNFEKKKCFSLWFLYFTLILWNETFFHKV